MAGILLAASFLTYNKIKDKRAAKKEAKRKGYEARYSALEYEHLQDQEKRVQSQQTGSSQGTDQQVPTRPVEASEAQQQDVSSDLPARRRSSESDRASIHSRDDPSAWVDDVVKERKKRGDLG
jgi:hypothetical protein